MARVFDGDVEITPRWREKPDQDDSVPIAGHRLFMSRRQGIASGKRQPGGND